MKNILMVVLALSLVLSVSVFTHVATAVATPALTAAPQGAPLKTMQGTVKADGDKLTFVNDEDNKAWSVMNPDALKGHEGHHVEVSVHLYADKSALHVMTVKMVKKADK